MTAHRRSWRRKEREFAFCGDIDFIPTEQYTRADADRAIAGRLRQLLDRIPASVHVHELLRLERQVDAGNLSW